MSRWDRSSMSRGTICQSYKKKQTKPLVTGTYSEGTDVFWWHEGGLEGWYAELTLCDGSKDYP